MTRPGCEHKMLRHRATLTLADGSTRECEARICVGCGAWLAIPEPPATVRSLAGDPAKHIYSAPGYLELLHAKGPTS